MASWSIALAPVGYFLLLLTLLRTECFFFLVSPADLGELRNLINIAIRSTGSSLSINSFQMGVCHITNGRPKMFDETQDMFAIK